MCRTQRFTAVYKSGLVYGIDTLAYKYAIGNNLNTIAVVDVVYSSSNREL
ncbi:MAG: hypothetical protein AB8V03_04725 [Francisella endosymbiont of Hyalomma asiaticum]